MAYKDISFGLISAAAERSSDPGLIRDGHIDFMASSEEALNGTKYLFLGYKGAGKSSLGERLSLILEGNYDKFLRLVSLEDFPFTPFSKIVRGDSEPEAKYPTAWSWILLIYILESFDKDEGFYHHDRGLIEDTIKAFRQMGLSPNAEPASIVRKSSRNNFKLNLPGKLAEYSWAEGEDRPASEIPNFVESLKEIVRGLRSESKHYLVIDGLDDILTSREVQYKSLSALLYEVSRLNADFKKNEVPAKIILLCRTDLFERIPGANKNKIRHDFSLEFDWYHDPQKPGKSLLVEAAQLRTNRSLGENIDLFEDLLPASINGKDTQRKLLEMTRHTPRDFLQLLSHIQSFCTDAVAGAKSVESGMRDYSIKYFLPEIQDELSGYADPIEIESIVGAFSRIGKRDFKFSELLQASQGLLRPMNPERVYEISQALFNCSALGNIQYAQGGKTYYTFKYRNRHSVFNENESIMLHRGLWKALNV